MLQPVTEEPAGASNENFVGAVRSDKWCKEFVERGLVIDFKRLLTEDYSKDVKFHVGTQEFSAHKFILTTRSPVFKRMFPVGTTERTIHVVSVQDANPVAFKMFLEFLYGCDYKDNKFLVQLLYLADKYEVADLKTLAANDLERTINNQNAVGVIIVLQRFHEYKHVYSVARFISKNKAQAFTQEMRQTLQNAYPHLVELVDFGI